MIGQFDDFKFNPQSLNPPISQSPNDHPIIKSPDHPIISVDDQD
jgi:hypothetical protein